MGFLGGVTHDRAPLGPADVGDDQLSAMVAHQLGVSRAEVLTCDVSVAEYDLEALTTAARFWVRGTAAHDGHVRPFAFFVKVVQSWTRTPAFLQVPEHLRATAAAGLPWRTEPLVYRSDLCQHLPPDFSMPAAHAVVDLDEESAAIWLAGVDVDTTAWDPDTFHRAARALGRFAASAAIEPVRAVGSRDVVQSYVRGRVEHQIAPTLRDAELWNHPLVADAFDDGLRTRILSALDAVPRFVAELADAPLGTAHGDACPRNLLRVSGEPDRFVLIDFGFLCEAPLGFDLSQLLLGEVQVGERPATDMAELEDLCLAAYVAGLRDEGCHVPLEAVRRYHALLLLLFGGLSAVPLEVAYGMPAPGGPQVVRNRAQAARFILDLVDTTTPTTPTSPAGSEPQPSGPRSRTGPSSREWTTHGVVDSRSDRPQPSAAFGHRYALAQRHERARNTAAPVLDAAARSPWYATATVVDPMDDRARDTVV